MLVCLARCRTVPVHINISVQKEVAKGGLYCKLMLVSRRCLKIIVRDGKNNPSAPKFRFYVITAINNILKSFKIFSRTRNWSLILLWLTFTFCFWHIGLSIQRSKDRLGIPNVIFAMKLFRKSVASRTLEIPILVNQGGKGLNPQSFKPYMFPVSLNKRNSVRCAKNRKRPRERFTPIAPHHNMSG